jgi:hypothetical protein
VEQILLERLQRVEHAGHIRVAPGRILCQRPLDHVQQLTGQVGVPAELRERRLRGHLDPEHFGGAEASERMETGVGREQL